MGRIPHREASIETVKRKPVLLISEAEGFSPRAAARLRTVCDVVARQLDRPGLLQAAKDSEILWVRLANGIDREVFDAAPRLQAVVTATTGLNHIDLETAEGRGIRVMSLRGETDFLRQVRATAELTLGLILALVRMIPQAVRHTLEGGWSRDLFKGRELFGKTAGVVGYGRLGQQMGQYLSAMGLTVIASDPHVTSAGVPLLPLNELLAEADLVTLHVQLSAATAGMFGAAEFSRMKPGSWFVNTSRGELVDEPALERALVTGRLGGAALDVLCGENSAGMSSHPLVRYASSHGNLLITPHVGGCTQESMQKCEEFMADRVAEWLGDRGTCVPEISRCAE